MDNFAGLGRIGPRTMRALAALVATTAFAVLLPVFASGDRAGSGTCPAVVRVGGHVYGIQTGGFSCAVAQVYVLRLAGQKPVPTSIGHLSGVPTGFTCWAIGYPQVTGRCTRPSSGLYSSVGFVWTKVR